jgi:hypothetical protein
MRTITNVTNVLVIDSLSASPPAIIQGSLVQTLFPLYVEFVLYMARTYSSLFINSYIRTLTQNIPARNTSIKEQYLHQTDRTTQLKYEKTHNAIKH